MSRCVDIGQSLLQGCTKTGKKRLFALCLLSTLLLIIISMLIQNEIVNDELSETSTSSETAIPPDHKIILMWTSFFGSRYWMFGPWRGFSTHCAVRKCAFTANRNMLHNSSLVLFHYRDLEQHQRYLPQIRLPWQSWILFTMEAPPNSFLKYGKPKLLQTLLNIFGDQVDLNNMFNSTMTYMHNSDIWIPYGNFHKNNPDRNATSKGLRHPTKTKLVLWFVSNCQSERMNYVQELKRYISVDIYGDCGVEDPCPRGNQQCMSDLTDTYKFYIAFENTQCREYITEKFWFALDHNMVPIVLGANMDDYAAVSPPQSFLHVDNFSSPEDLANYLLYLDTDESAYNSYHKWKLDFHIGSGETSAIALAACQLCSLAHNLSHGIRGLVPILDWFSEEKQCR